MPDMATRHNWTATIAGLCLLPCLVFAQNKDEITAVPNRPTVSTTAETVQPGVFEFEYGFESGRSHQNVNGLLKFGVSSNLELRFGNDPIERDSGIAGVGDSSAGFKYRFLDQHPRSPSVSLLYAATLPTADTGLGAGTYGHFVAALISKDFAKHHLDLNEGVQFLGRGGASGFDHNYFSALAYSHPILRDWGWTGELSGSSRTNRTAPATMNLLGALTRNISSRLVLDGGVSYAAFGNLPRVTLLGGVTYSVADLYAFHRRATR